MAESEIIIIEEGNIEVEVKEYSGNSSGGDMLKSTYDTDDSGVVDNAEKVNGYSEADNITGAVKFTNIFGTWINSADTPLTVPITFDLSNAINGAITAVYYQAAALEITDTDDRIVMQNIDAFVSNELCLVWFAYDKGTGAIHVNLLAGDTGNRPAPIGNARPVITLIDSTPVEVIENETYVDAGATAYDVEDGDITADIVTVNNVNTAIIGAYTVTYNVVDSLGLSAIEVGRIVNVISNVTAPDAPTNLTLTEQTI